MFDLLQRAHDSCMGFSFNANAFLAPKRGSFSLGSIVNRQSLKIVNTIADLGLPFAQFTSIANIISKPCYEKRDTHGPLKLMLGENFILQLPDVNENLNKEINDAISATDEAKMQVGAWYYIDMKDGLKKILDTTHNPKLLRYRDNLLDTSNMVLAAPESVTDISFIINAGKNISNSLQAFLKSKPSVSLPNSQISIHLFYPDSDEFQMTLNGIFPVVGEFRKAELK